LRISKIFVVTQHYANYKPKKGRFENPKSTFFGKVYKGLYLCLWENRYRNLISGICGMVVTNTVKVAVIAMFTEVIQKEG
jgi:hypothetical protein